MIKANLYNTNAKQIKNLYFEKGTKQDYTSKFFSYDKHKIKKKALFYFRLTSFKNKEKQNKKSSFSFIDLKENKNLFSLHKALTHQRLGAQVNFLQPWCENYSRQSTITYTPYVNLGISSHGDNCKAYGKQNKSI